MAKELSFCFLTNGRGEDWCAAQIGSILRTMNSGVRISGAPMITEGEELARRGIEIATMGRILPSGGFSMTTLKGFLGDVPHYLSYARYLRNLRRIAKTTDMVVAVGDITILLFAGFGLRKPVTYIALAKSDYKGKHYRIELTAMRLFVSSVITRDALTASSLRAAGINAHYLGNPMMDGLCARSAGAKSGTVVGLLPGSRDEAYGNFRKMLSVLELVPQKPMSICAVPSCLDVNRLMQSAVSVGWEIRSDYLHKNGYLVRIISGSFEKLIADSDVVLGMAGTANEQAVGLGIPVVSISGSGPQTTPRRMRRQEMLMGGAIKFIPGTPEKAAEEISNLLSDPEERLRRGLIGKTRMGEPGASESIARFLLEGFATDHVQQCDQLISMGADSLGK